MPAPPPAPRPKRSGFLAAVGHVEGSYNADAATPASAS
jgi:hypothetical protein